MADENEKKVKKDSFIGIVFQVVGILIWVIGGIVGIIGLITALGSGYGMGPAILGVIGVALTGMFFYGFGEALSLLKEIYVMLKNQQ